MNGIYELTKRTIVNYTHRLWSAVDRYNFREAITDRETLQVLVIIIIYTKYHSRILQGTYDSR